MWLRELRILCKLCKLWTERRSSRSSRVDLNALITRSCKNREGRSIRKRGGKPATHKHAIFSFRLFFFSVAQKKCMRRYRVYVCMFVCTYVCTCVCVCHVCIPLFHVVAVRFRFDFRVFSVHVISVYTGSVVVVLVAVVSRFVTCRCISHVFIYFITFTHSFVPCVCSLYLRISSPYILLVTFPRSQSTWLHFTRIRELINGTDPNTIGSYEDWKERRRANAPN